MEKRSNLHLFVILLSIFFVWSCDNTLKNKSVFSPEATVTARQGGPGVSVESPGNNLSYPVIWSDGVTINLRGTYGDAVFNGQYFYDDGYIWYVQNDALNEWQAESRNEALVDTYISLIDWGDNLEAKSWSVGDQVRLEIVLYKVLSTPMEGYTMRQNLNTQSALMSPDQTGTTEVWGTNKEMFTSDTATVYSGTGKLVIQRLADLAEGTTPNLTWDPVNSVWTGDVSNPIIDKGVWETTEGPGGFSAEVNVAGKVVYGFNWITNTSTSDEPGTYRVTFVLDRYNDASIPCKTIINKDTKIKVNIEESILVPLAAAGSDDGSDQGGGVAAVGDNMTYIDVYLGPRNGSGKPAHGGGRTGNGGGGSGQNNGGNGHHGGQSTPVSN